ncbi:MAG TPA: transferrin receptor-like dimerization domain-containing protein [Thermoanaerobaculia bacterium]|nr:transferrin receptor-like dimerization domain-containing protein [Thermoanaerobaculia bacterium]
MKRLPTVLMAVFLLAAAARADEKSAIRGFLAGSAADETARETAFRSAIDPNTIRETMRTLSARPHHTGSEQDRINAEWILDRFRSFGWDAKIETFDVLFPTPSERILEMTAPVQFTAKLAEPAVAEDPTSSQKSEQLPTYNAYSIDGDVTAPLVYVNYGIPADYEELDRLGVSVAGKIAIARYGHSWRGIKPKVAAEHGAVGCIIYSDPHEDGYREGDVFPKGPFRPPDGVQRGSVADMPLYPGDPETPGTGSVPGGKRLALSEAKTLTKIPVMPISYADAEPMLRRLDGPMAPDGWRGALPFSYHVGPGAATVHLRVKSHWDVKPVRDVVATLRGAQFPDDWIVRGNHYDAWVNGAEDPISGQSAMLEEARALGDLWKKGWRPKRTIVYCAWDGEEPGLLGSTEWAETHADELSRKAVVYINSDSNARGFWNAGASHSLQRFFQGVAESVTDPESRVSIAERLRRRAISEAARRERAGERDSEEAPTPEEVRGRKENPVDALGSGSDYTVFIDHLGIASANVGFDGEDDGGIYHSIYDDFFWYTHFSDRDFVYGRALAQAAGTAVLRLAGADLLPFDFEALSEAVAHYIRDIRRQAEKERAEVREKNREIEEGVFAAIDDPRRPTIAPKEAPVPPVIGFAPLENAQAKLADAAKAFDRAFDAALAAGARPEILAAANEKLKRAERTLLSDAGLPGRPWFRHQVYAPGFYTGYGVKTLPAVREAVEQKKWDLAEREVARVAGVIEKEAALVADIAAGLGKAPR